MVTGRAINKPDFITLRHVMTCSGEDINTVALQHNNNNNNNNNNKENLLMSNIFLHFTFTYIPQCNTSDIKGD